jgi:subtilisin family serine protease
MTRFALPLATFAAVLLTAAPSASAAPVPETVMVDAVVVLRSQLDPATIQAPGRAARQAAVVRALRARASAAQRPLLAELDRQRRRHLVSRIEPLWIINAVGITATPSVLRGIAARPEVRDVRPELAIQAPPRAATRSSAAAGDVPVEPNLTQINVPALWALGYRGQGVVVANLDTGVDATHPDLASRWRGGTNSWYDPNGQHPTVPTDINGHGTATMGVMVGGDAGGTSVGVAPDARWIAVKIFNDRGVATSTTVHRGLQWLLDPDGNPATPDAPDVVNNSWTFAAGGCNRDFQLDLINLRTAGILPVFAAGNYGPTAGSIGNPATNPEAFAVGSVDGSDVIDPSSSRGPSPCGQATAPALVAPGVNVRTTDLYGGYIYASGTSMAAPHVAGTLALLRSAQPGTPAERQAAALTAGAVDLGPPGADNTYGYGRLDALASYQWLTTAPDYTVSVTPTTASTVAGGTVSYTVSVNAVNGFAGDVTLGLSGLSASQGTASFTPPVITGGTGTASLSVTTATGLAQGTYPLTVSALSGPAVHGAAAVLVVTPPPDFGLAATPASATVNAGSAATYTTTVTATGGFTGTVSLSASGLPATVGAAAFTPASVSGAGPAQLRISTLAGAPGGSYQVTITATSGSLVHQASVTLVVVAQDFTVAASPAALTLTRRQSGSVTVTVGSVAGFAGGVALSVGGLPSATTASFSINPVYAPGSATLTIATTSGTPRGTYTLVVTGTAGPMTRSVTLTLTVR